MDFNILGLTYFLILKKKALTLFSLTERSITGHFQLRFASILTHKYLPLSVEYSLLPHSFTFLLLRFKDRHFSPFKIERNLGCIYLVN